DPVVGAPVVWPSVLPIVPDAVSVAVPLSLEVGVEPFEVEPDVVPVEPTPCVAASVVEPLSPQAARSNPRRQGTIRADFMRPSVKEHVDPWTEGAWTCLRAEGALPHAPGVRPSRQSARVPMLRATHAV